MTSIGSYTKQVPLNNGYFRAITSLLPGESSISDFIYAPLGVTAAGTISSMVVNGAFEQLSLDAALFKDMGVQAVVQGSTFRRVQLVTQTPATGGVSGDVAGTDSDYLCGYILTGFGGAGVPGPFVRTG